VCYWLQDIFEGILAKFKKEHALMTNEARMDLESYTNFWKLELFKYQEKGQKKRKPIPEPEEKQILSKFKEIYRWASQIADSEVLHFGCALAHLHPIIHHSQGLKLQQIRPLPEFSKAKYTDIHLLRSTGGIGCAFNQEHYDYLTEVEVSTI
jgi:hypothetical protein